ncbi:MAG TPA: LacI family DNA-binding transcriptional regulator [Actinospica sp.]|jgi:DNA-binding LacI/PurR family transcriptional regulator|nr:LacI family DNA-binding transcriptional regulator [Actinospica sp.]
MVVTLADVAARAGVSASTVSYVISRKRPISPETRERVLRAVAELGYHPNAGARALASQRSNTIALMVPLRSDMYVPVLMEIAMSVATAARAAGQDVLLLTGDEGIQGLRRVVASGLADAVILMDVELDDERIPVLRELAIPAVLIGLPAETEGLTCVDLDFTAAGSVCADHLADLGHRYVALLGADRTVYRRRTGFAARTLDGFTRRALERGVRTVHRSCDGGFSATAATVDEVLEAWPSLSAFVVQNEAVVGPLLHLLAQHRRAVPEDVSVVAICPDQIAVQPQPRITSVPIPAEEMGRRAVRLAMAQLAGKPTSGSTLIRPKLVVRGSSAARARS